MKILTHTLILIALILILAGCTSLQRVYPLTGATVGGGVGAIGGPATGAVGAAAGYAFGEILATDQTIEKKDDEIEKAKETIEALTKGDVSAILEQRLSEAQTSWADSILKEVWGMGKLALFFVVLWIIVPIVWSKFDIKRTRQKIEESVKKVASEVEQKIKES